MTKTYIVEKTVVRELPEVERPIRDDFITDDPFTASADVSQYNAALAAYNEILSRQPTVTRGDNGFWKEGQIVPASEMDFYDSNKWFLCKCQCGWSGSSENLLGGGQIADTGDYDDGYCPSCKKKYDGEDIGESYVGLVAIPKQKEGGEEVPMFYIKSTETEIIVAIHEIEPDEHRKGWLRGKVVKIGNDHTSYVGADWGISADHVFNSGLYDYSKNGFLNSKKSKP